MKLFRLLPLLLLPCAALAATPRTDWAPNITGTAAWQGNISNGGAVWDRISTLQLSLDGLASSRYELTRSDAVYLTGRLAGDWLPRFRELAQGTAGGRLDWQHVFGDDVFAPVFSLEGAGDATAFVESARSGFSGAVTLKLSKRFKSGWRTAVSERFEQYYANHAVFDRSSNETTVEISRDLSESSRVTLSGRWREGDVVTHAHYDRPDLAALAHHSELVTTFGDPMTAYAADARTVGGRLALMHAITDDTALILSYEYAQTKRGAFQFENQTIALSHVRQY